MATQSTDLNDQKSGATTQTEDQTLTLPNGWNGPKEMEASGSTPSCSSSRSLVRWLMPDHPETWYCLEIQATLTEEAGTTPSPTHTWQVPVVEDMLCDGKAGHTKVIVMGPEWAMLFHGQQLLGEGLSLGEAWDVVFMLSGTLSWVGQQAQLNANTWKTAERPVIDCPSHHQTTCWS